MDFACPCCGRTIRVRDEYVGRKTRCHACGEKVTIPPLSEAISPRDAREKPSEPEVDMDDPSVYDKYEEFRCKQCQRVYAAAALKRKQEKVCMYCGGDLRPRKSTERGKKGAKSGGSRVWGAAVAAGGYISHEWKGDMDREHRVGVLKHARMEQERSGLLGPKWCAYYMIFTNRRILMFEVDRDQSSLGGGFIGPGTASPERIAEIDRLYRENDIAGLRKLAGKHDREISVGEIKSLREQRGKLVIELRDGARLELDVGEYAAMQIQNEMAPCVGKRPRVDLGSGVRMSVREVSAEFDRGLLVVKEHLGALHDAKLFISPGIPEDRLQNALESYAAGIRPDAVLVLFDGTVFHSGKLGFCLTPTTLLWQNRSSDEPGRKEIRDIKIASVDPGGVLSPAKILIDREEIALSETHHGREIAEKMIEILRALKALSPSTPIEEPSPAPGACAKCGARVEPTDRFCRHCGAKTITGKR